MLATCLRGMTSVCPSVTGYASANAIACSFSIHSRLGSREQKGQNTPPILDGGICALAAPCSLVFDCHRVRVDCLLACDSFQPSQYAAIITFVGLESDSALFSRIVPSNADEVLLGFRKRHESANAKRYGGKPNCSADTPMNVLTIAHLSDSRGRQ